MGNDITIIIGIVAGFLLISFLGAYINAEFGEDIEQYDQTLGVPDINDTLTPISDASDSNAKGIIVSVLTIWLWDFSGNVPDWLNILLFIPRIALAITIARNIWIGGGG